MQRIFVSHPLPVSLLAELGAEAELDIWAGEQAPNRSELLAALENCDGLLCLLTDRVDSHLIAACPRLLWVSSMSVGVDHVDVSALTARNIPLGHTPGVLVDTTADLTFALLLSAARRVAEGDRFVRAGRWTAEERWSPNMFVGKDVAGATLGIVGLGEIGCAVARRAAGFGMRVLGWTRSGRRVAGVESLELSELLAQADFISINVALSAETRNLIGREEIAAMKPGAVLVNTARGGIVDEYALADALASGHLAAAGCDVFEQEPIAPDHPLLALENVVLVPHIGSASEVTRGRMASLAVANLLAAVRGQPMPHCVNPEAYLAAGK